MTLAISGMEWLVNDAIITVYYLYPCQAHALASYIRQTRHCLSMGSTYDPPSASPTIVEALVRPSSPPLAIGDDERGHGIGQRAACRAIPR